MMNCPLCSSTGEHFYKDEFFLCTCCGAIFKNKKLLLKNEEEKERYLLHSENCEDIGYQNFVSPITKSVMIDFKQDNTGLDFGSGQSQIVAYTLQKNNYDVKVYDPYFSPNIENLKIEYDYITACEVIEHFNNPEKEFTLLRSLLKEGGKLYCMTHLYDETIDFAQWYYKNDSTHVFMYQIKTIEWIVNHFNFKTFFINKRLIIFSV